MRRLLAYLAVLALSLGCGAMGEATADYGDPVDLRPDDLVGTWQAGTRRSLVFAADHTFTAVDLPPAVFGDRAPRGAQRLDGAGSWELAASRLRDDGPTSIVRLKFGRLGGDSIRNSGPELEALRQDGVVYLVFFYEDGDNAWTAYRHCTPECR